jgi:hypothetical protein
MTAAPSWADDPPPPIPAGEEILARGPIHEGYAEPSDAKPVATPVAAKQPPPAIEEIPPDEKPEGENVEWLPGYWGWDDQRNDYIWVSGIWRMAPPNRQWIPGHWSQATGGWQWTPGFWSASQQTEVQYLPAPPAPVTTAASTPAPDADSTFVPGIWVYRETRYVWRPGYWMNHRAGWIWIPDHYVWTPSGYLFVPGYWDFELDRRGLLFAPVAFTQPLWNTPGWRYQPQYAIHTDFLFGALFIRAGYGNYYFGNYFGADFAHGGFTAWIDFHGGGRYDPLFSYYRWANRENRQWLPGMRTLYAGRFSGAIPRPAITLREQQVLIRKVAANKIANINYVNGIAPLSRMGKEVVSLQHIDAAERDRYHAMALETRKFADRRLEAERGVAAHEKAAAAVHSVKIEPPHREAVHWAEKNTPPAAAYNRAVREEPMREEKREVREAPRVAPRIEKPGTAPPHIEPRPAPHPVEKKK